MGAVLPHSLEFVPGHDAEIFFAVPAAAAVFLLRGREEGAEPYVAKTANLRRRLQRLLGPQEERSRKLNLRERVAHIEYALTGSDFESGFVLYQVLRRAFPDTYEKRLRLRPAPLVRLHMENRYPRVSVTTHLSGARSGSIFYGPFASRAAAEKFANDALDFFLLRRCVEELNPDPAFPGCIYSEMKMCLAPCFKGCTDEHYAAETARVQAFFDSRGLSLAREMAAERDRASAELHFEEAAAVHAKIDKLTPVLSQLPEITRRLDKLDALMIQPSAQRDSVTLFRITGGAISPPIQFPVSDVAQADVAQPPSAATHKSSKPTSMEARIREALGASQPGAAVPHHSQKETLEHLAILKRWYFRSVKTGEIFFADDKGELPMRRVVRGISRVFRGEKPSGDLDETARDYWVNRGREAEIK